MKRAACGFANVACLLVLSAPAMGQGRQEPGHSIGAVSTQGNLIVMTLEEGALGKANFFDLGRRTLRFTPEGAGYRVENRALQWDADLGPEMSGSRGDPAEIPVSLFRQELGFLLGGRHRIHCLWRCSCGRARWRRWPRRRSLRRPFRAVAGCGSDTRQYRSSHLRLLQAAHVGNSISEGTGRSRRNQLECDRTRGRHSRLHVGANCQPLSVGASQEWLHRDVLR